jgi:tRNA(fMet)-specific endonuclease VapC
MRLIDTSICISILRESSPRLRSRFRAAMGDGVAVSSITAAELYVGVAKSLHRDRTASGVANLLAAVSILPFDATAAQAYGIVRSHLERRGDIMGPLDLLIAAHAIAENAVLVTSNTHEFNRVPTLEIEDWV